MSKSRKRALPTAAPRAVLRSGLSLLLASEVLLDLHQWYPRRQLVEDVARGWPSFAAEAAVSPQPFKDDGMFDPRRDYWADRTGGLEITPASSNWESGDV